MSTQPDEFSLRKEVDPLKPFHQHLTDSRNIYLDLAIKKQNGLMLF